MFDGPLMLRVNLPVDERIHPQGNKIFTGVKIKAMGDSKVHTVYVLFMIYKTISVEKLFTIE